MADFEDLLQNDQLKKAVLQDKVIKIIFDTIQDCVFHGGTCVWRCYGGRRFSKDIDVYIAKDGSIKKVLNRLVQNDFDVKKDSRRRSTLFYTVRNSTDISLQIHKASADGRIASYLEVDGTMSDVYALSPEAIILEKIDAYNDRRLERDIYDIRVLTNSVVEKKSVVKALTRFLGLIERPKDAGALSNLVYEGLIPTFDDMIVYLNRWCRL